MSAQPDRQKEILDAFVGAARMKKRIWITADAQNVLSVEVFCKSFACVAVLALPSHSPSCLAALGQAGDVLVVLPNSPMEQAWLAVAHELSVRCILLAAQNEGARFDIPFCGSIDELIALAQNLAACNAQVQMHKFFSDWAGLSASLSGLRPLVFTNGVFDILHRGHVHSLQAARAEGAYLVVGINSDASVKRLGKGPDRPIQTAEDRAALLAALSCVDFVTIFDEDTPARLIEAVSPDVLVKGGDYTPDQIAGAEFVKSRGGRVVTIAFEHDRSTSQILKKIRSHA